MTEPKGNPNDEAQTIGRRGERIGRSCFVIYSSFVIRNSDL